MLMPSGETSNKQGGMMSFPAGVSSVSPLATPVLLQWVTGMEATCGVDISEDHLISLRWSTSGT